MQNSRHSVKLELSEKHKNQYLKTYIIGSSFSRLELTRAAVNDDMKEPSSTSFSLFVKKGKPFEREESVAWQVVPRSDKRTFLKDENLNVSFLFDFSRRLLKLFFSIMRTKSWSRACSVRMKYRSKAGRQVQDTVWQGTLKMRPLLLVWKRQDATSKLEAGEHLNPLVHLSCALHTALSEFFPWRRELFFSSVFCLVLECRIFSCQKNNVNPFNFKFAKNDIPS